MKTSKSTKSVLILVFISMILFSCGAHHHLSENMIYRDREFSYGHLKANGMIIGGVSSHILDLTDKERTRYNIILTEALVEKFKGIEKIRMIKTFELTDKIGQDNYAELMENFDTEKTIDKESIRLLKDNFPDRKYALFARIENENVVDHSFDQIIEDHEGEEKLETEYSKTYLMAVEFQIYDILQEKLVWNNLIFNEANRTESRTTDTGCVQGCTDNLIQSILWGEPAEISRNDVMSKIVEKLAEDLLK